MTKDIFDRFLSRYEKPAPDPSDPSLHMDVKDAEALQDQLAGVVDPLPLPDMDQQQRDAGAGKRFPAIQDLMFETAAGLRRCPEVLEEVGVAPEVFEESARQDMAIGGFLMAVNTVAGNADTGQLLAAGEGDDLAQKTEDRLKAATTDPATDPEQRRAVGFLFADALRLRANLKKDAQGQPAPGPSPAHAQQLQQQQNLNQRRQQVQQFLSDLSAGRESFLSKALGPAGTATHKTHTTHKTTGAKPQP